MLAILVLVTTIGVLEAAARVLWSARYGVPLSRPRTVLYALYPELWQVEWKDAELRGQDAVRILFLSGSALHPAWGNVEQELRERLTVKLGRPVVIFNMAAIGHTSRDSVVKYRALEHERFDLVVFYHGINDARANNVPPERFRADYSHYAWYDAVNALEPRRGSRWTILPATLRFLSVRLKERLGFVDYVPMDAPRPEWLEYGGDIKSAASFEANLRAVAEMAHAKHEPLMVMTFATYVPAGYSLEAFSERTLDYTLHLSPIEMWGSPANVLAAVSRHNEIVRRVASDDPELSLVDQASAMPKRGRFFNDICHLTGAGSSVFVENMLGVTVEMLSAPGQR
jgi:hypothetical protein